MEDLIKVYEARLTEEETISLDPAKVEAYRNALKVSKMPKQHTMSLNILHLRCMWSQICLT